MIRRALVAGLLCLAAGCTVETQSLSAPYTLTVRVSDPDEVPFTAPIRVAVGWRLSTGLYVVSDTPVELAPGGTALLSLKLRPLSADLQPYISPLNGLTLLETELIRLRPLAHRVWIFAYEDVDGDGQFGPPRTSPTVGADRVVSVDAREGPAVAYVPDLDKALAEVGLRNSALFYDLYGDGYSGFFRVTDDGSETRMAVIPGEAPPIELTIGANPGLTEAVACRTRSISYFRGTTDRTIIFDPEVVPLTGGANPCAGAPEDEGPVSTVCQIAIVDELPPPDMEELPPSEETRRLICETDGTFSALQVRETITRCEGCLCLVDLVTTDYVVPRALRPEWWPCGAEEAPECDAGVITPWLSGCGE